ncbi:MAG: rRNA maturation RNase YbeY [Candidatus Moranbacteria bacterium]|nr:rRNA maturation RNase YbeY [Candidatus Moranbacteria bacterium]
MPVNFHIFSENQKFNPPAGLKKILVFAVDKLKLKIPPNINLIFTGNRKIKTLNRKFRGLNKPTDILTFNYSSKQEKNPEAKIGEIFINPDYIQKNSKKEEDPNQSIKKIFIHGIVHLAGYDHKTKEQRKKMQAIEQKIQKAVLGERLLTNNPNYLEL